MAVLLWVVLGVVCFVGSLGAFVLALLKPRTGPMSERQQAALAAVRKTFNFAHRGLFDNVTVPENSLAAFKKAVDHGYGFEFDVQLTADNKLAISHDDTICARLYEPSPKHSVDIIGKRISEVTYEAIVENVVFKTDKEHTICLLEDVLAAVGGRVPIIVELKDQHDTSANQRLVELVEPLLRAYSGVATVQSFNPYVVRAFSLLPGAAEHYVLGQLGCHLKPAELPSATARFAVAHFLSDAVSHPHYLACCVSEYDRSLAALAARVWPGTPRVMWTARSPEVYEKFRAAGVDGIIFEGFEPAPYSADAHHQQ